MVQCTFQCDFFLFSQFIRRDIISGNVGRIHSCNLHSHIGQCFFNSIIYIIRNDISADELAKEKEITLESALNDPFSLPKPILNKLIDRAINENVWSDADKAIYEEKKSNMNFLPNFLSDAAKASLAELAVADKANISADKIFAGLVEGRISKHLKEICLLDQVYVKAEDGKQNVAAYLKSVDANLTVAKIVRFEVGEGMEKKNEDFAAEVAAQLG
ncbi:MAG: hypothetical protein K6G30_02925 [Acetatifactor sp.]|nr:hypothetical protein [Acetatifactor sp.]